MNVDTDAPAQVVDTPSHPEPEVAPRKTLRQRGLDLLANPKTPIVAGVIVLGVAAVFVAPKLFPFLRSAPNIVVFDPVRFTNSQRAAASILAVNPNSDLTLTMTQVAKHAELVIKEEANGAVVLIKQSVVVPDDLRDITEDVLNRFGLPTNVPTVTNRGETMVLQDLAPTDSLFTPGQLREEHRIELEARAQALAKEKNKQARQDLVLP